MGRVAVHAGRLAAHGSNDDGGHVVATERRVRLMRVRLEPQDEYMHELGPEPNFNESMYFNVYDPGAQVGAFFRLGNRANEGRGEMTICLYLPDGRVAFMYQRPEVHTNDAFDAAGMRFEVVTPFEELRVSYTGKVVLLEQPLEMADPRKAFTENPYADCAAELTYFGTSAMFGGEPEESHERPGEEFAKGHYEQLVAAKGTIRVGDQQWDIDGHGLRDHSWGPRYWQAPWYYRWLTANFGPDFGFMGSRIARRDAKGTRADSSGTATRWCRVTTSRSAPSGKATTSTTAPSGPCCAPRTPRVPHESGACAAACSI